MTNVDFDNLQKLRVLLEKEGGISSKLDPNEVEFLEEQGFVVSPNYAEDPDDAGKLECLISLNQIQ